MRELDRTRLAQACRSRGHLGFSWSLATVLCLLVAVVLFGEVTSSLPGSKSHFTPGQPLANVVDSSTRSVIKLSERVSVDQALVKANRPEDALWRSRETGSIKRSSSGIGAEPESYRTFSLNEVAQRKLLSHAPMEFTTAAAE